MRNQRDYKLSENEDSRNAHQEVPYAEASARDREDVVPGNSSMIEIDDEESGECAKRSECRELCADH